MKITNVTSKELLIDGYGVYAVQEYERVKAGSMRLGHETADLLLRAVGGRAGQHGEKFDGLTRLGQWEFCLSRDSKNDSGNRHDLERAPGRCVQILEQPKPGWMSGEDFLVCHGEDASGLLIAIDEMRSRLVLYEQMRLRV